jgi:hypothetical protein
MLDMRACIFLAQRPTHGCLLLLLLLHQCTLFGIELQELLSLEVVELRRELEGLEAELAAAQRDAAHASNRVRGRTCGTRNSEHA